MHVCICLFEASQPTIIYTRESAMKWGERNVRRRRIGSHATVSGNSMRGEICSRMTDRFEMRGRNRSRRTRRTRRRRLDRSFESGVSFVTHDYCPPINSRAFRIRRTRDSCRVINYLDSAVSNRSYR